MNMLKLRFARLLGPLATGGVTLVTLPGLAEFNFGAVFVQFFSALFSTIIELLFGVSGTSAPLFA